MLFTAAISALALTSQVLAERTRCGHKDPGERLIASHEAHDAETRVPNSVKFSGGASTYSIDPNALINVATYVHVVTSSAEAANFDQNMVDSQLDVLNSAYGTNGIKFKLQGTTFTVNDAWASATDDSTEEYDMKSSLRQGNYGDLNLYFLSNLGGGLLGVCPFPTSHNGDDDTFKVDGCMIQASSMPGGDETNYNMGGTAVHEIGHWFGLFHVFQGDNCAAGGDHIVDTPRQSTSTSGCPASKDSCPGVQGLDSIHNYMDYSYDECYEEFTPNQQYRAHRLYSQFRANYATPVY